MKKIFMLVIRYHLQMYVAFMEMVPIFLGSLEDTILNMVLFFSLYFFCGVILIVTPRLGMICAYLRVNNN